MDVGIARTELAEIVLVRHGPESPNVEPRSSVCSARGVNFVEENSFVLGFGKREWLVDQGCAFITEAGRVHRYSHLRGVPPDSVLCVRFTSPLLECMREELPTIDFARLEPVLGKRNDLRFLRWRLGRLLHPCHDLAIDEWVVDLVAATCLHDSRARSSDVRDAQFAWYAERVDAAREQLSKKFADQHRLRALARSVGMSTFHFARVFRELVGVAPHRYLLHVRYRAALQMLLEGATVTDACYQTGFANLSHFTRQFKLRFGQSPSSTKGWPRDVARRPLIAARLPE